ncbi:MAG: L,D-transpeptidase family protein [Aestuariivirga sp.]|nr:L,D-transpeptidase family protein [Aestuariivirga sp.]
MVLKFGSAGRLLFSKTIGVSLAAMLSMSLAGAPVVKAEPSDEMREFVKKQKLKSKGLLGSYTPSTLKADPTPSGKAVTATEVFSTQVVAPMLSAGGMAEMRAAESKYAAIVSNGGWPKVPKGASRKGSEGKEVMALNQRLFIEGYVRPEAAEGDFASIFTSATQDGLMRFQRNNGLAASGQMDGATLQALNVSAAERLTKIRANIPRIAEYSKDLGDRYVVVNIPAQQIETVNGNRVFSRHNAIVGRPSRPTPVVMTALSDINFNPYWNAPPSIVERDILPKMSSGILEKMNMKVFDGVGGPEVNPRRINWRRAVVDNYHFRQEPGGGNAMATAKINFSSPFGIYLHDTPEQHLFDSSSRFYSSGCVRVQKVAVLLNWILNGQDGIDPNRIEYFAQSLERKDVKLAAPPQLRVTYLTAWPTSDGTVAFRGDVYGLDGTGFVVGQPLPVGEKTASGERFVLKPVPRQLAQIDEAEADGFFWFGKRSRKDDSAADSRSTSSVVKKSKSASFFSRDDDSKDAKKKIVKKKIASTSKTKTVAEAKKSAAKVTTNVASASSKKAVKPAAPAAKKPNDLCKPDKDGKLPKDCKVEAAAKPKVKPAETASATN